MIDIKDLMDSAQTAKYISTGLKDRGLNGWKNPVSSLGVAVSKGQISPVTMPGANGQRVPKRYFDRETCDLFIAGYRSPGNQATDLSSIITRLGYVPDIDLAQELGVCPRTVGRERERRGIARF